MKLFGFNISRVKDDSAFRSAYRSNTRGTIPGPTPTDAKNEYPEMTRAEMMKGARFFDKRSGFVRGMSQDMALYSIGDGFRAQAKASDRAWNKAAEQVFSDWAMRADITGRHSLTSLLHLVSRSVDRDGEVFAIKTRNRYGRPAVQLIEGHRCMDGEKAPEGMVDGILFDSYGAPAAYRFLRDDGTFRDVPGGAVSHIHDPESVSAARARPGISHGIDRLVDEREILSAGVKGVKDQMQVTRAVIAPEDAQESTGAAFGAAAGQGAPSPSASDINRAIGGATVMLSQGSSVQNLTVDMPSERVMSLLDHLMRDTASGNLPYEFTRDPTKIGGAVVRLVVAKAGRAFSHRQTLIIEQFLNGLWSWVIADAIARGELAANADFWRVSWVCPRNVSVDAGRDSNANRQDVIAGLKTWSDHFAENGMDFEEEMERRARDAKFIVEISKATGVPLRFLYNPSPNTGMIPDIAEAGAETPAADATSNGNNE